MGTPRRGYIPYVLCAVLMTASAINVQTPQKVVEAARGKSAKLPCNYQTTADRSGGSVAWKTFPAQDEVTTYYFGFDPSNGTAYQGRVSFSGNVKDNDASIVIDQLTMQDNGTYQCEVTIRQDRAGTPIAKMDLIVLVAPSKPDCGIVGTAEYGQVIKLTCNSREGSPAPDYTWKSYTPQDVERQLPLTSVIEGGELTLKNISMDTSGFFICTSSNKIGKESCNLTLAVMPPSMNIGFYAGIIGGSVAGIIVIGIIAYCCCCRDKEDKDDYEMAEREEEDPEDVPQQKIYQKPQKQQRYEEEEDDDDDYQDRSSSRAGPPLPPGNKPRLVIDPEDV
ncbi:cell surface A33 antigen [Rhinophrynus dorsalis]